MKTFSLYTPSGIFFTLSICCFLTGCSGEKHPQGESSVELNLPENVTNESVVKLLEKTEDGLEEDAVAFTIEERNSAKETQQKRLEIISKEVASSPFNGYTNEQIKVYLDAELQKYASNCDSTTFNSLRRVLNADAVMKVFTANEIDYYRDYREQLKAAMGTCR